MRAIDLFAGAGGFTEGARRAGARVVWSANHWRLAVDVHAARHPDVEHSCQDLQQADFSRVPDHELLLASPACQGHSAAGQPGRARWGLDHNPHTSDRATAWAVVAAADAKLPPWLVVENVPQFRDWRLYGAWRGALETLGYRLEELVLDAADFGAPQNRARLFVCGRLGRAPGLAGAFPTPARRNEPRATWRPMAAILDVAGGTGWRPVAGKSAAVRERVERSRPRCGDVFLTQHVRDHMGRRLEQPLPTITGGDQMALVRGDVMRPLTVGEYLAGQGFAADYLADVPMRRRDAVRLVGNAVAVPVATAIVGAILSVA